jgi:hypothetical protein
VGARSFNCWFPFLGGLPIGPTDGSIATAVKAATVINQSVVVWPHHVPIDVAALVPPYQSMWVAKKHTIKPSPPMIPSRCKIKGRKEATHGLLHPPVICRCSNEQMPSYPHFTTTLGAPHQRRKAHSLVGVGQCPTMLLDGPLQPNRLSFGHMQEGTIWSNAMHQFKAVSLAVDPRVVRGSPMDWWYGMSSPYTSPL